MEIVKILKRKDASSVVAAIVVGFIVLSAVQDWASRPADWLSGQESTGGGWNAGLWRPLITLVVELVVFEIVVRVYTWLTSAQSTEKSHASSK
ncbi:MAG TPA: hypothetical protein VHD60_01590 [Candidatus Saccharimonadales bacterium]|nr:hypothetical protein [Candidatus Saccharimonadales bacterium]